MKLAAAKAPSGRGTPQHVAIELFQHMAGVRLSSVAHRGSAAALDDLLRGAADAMFDPAPSSMPHVRAGRLVALATTGPSRSAALPDLHAVGECLPGYEGGSWMGLGVPRQTPGGMVGWLNLAVNQGLQDTPDAAARRLPRGGDGAGARHRKGALAANRPEPRRAQPLQRRLQAVPRPQGRHGPKESVIAGSPTPAIRRDGAARWVEVCVGEPGAGCAIRAMRRMRSRRCSPG